MLDSTAVGREHAPFTFEVERGKIKEFCMAIGDDNPLFFDKEYAVKQGYKDTPAPLTFATVLNFWGNQKIWDNMKEIGVDIKRLLHASEEYEYFSPIYPGDVITGVLKVESIRTGGAMDIVTFMSTYKRNNEIVMIARMKIIVLIAGGE